jgi:NtrC-family two-component system sensor histidine kinase KinB
MSGAREERGWWATRLLTGKSVRVRVMLVFSLVLVAAIVFSLLILLQYHRMAIEGSSAAIREYARIEKLHAIKEIFQETFLESARNSSEATYPTASSERLRKIERARKLLAELEVLAPPISAKTDTGPETLGAVDVPGQELSMALDRVHDRLDAYEKAVLRQREPATILPLQDELQAASGAALALQRLAVYRAAHSLRREYEVGFKNGSLFLFVFVLVLSWGAFHSIHLLTGPLEELTRTLDAVRLDEAVPATLPAIRGSSPELTRLARSFEVLLQRLRSLRAFDLRRLLAEKRRADIIATAISDGIFLLKKGELTYVNPVGESMLGLSGSEGWRGLRVDNGAGSGVERVEVSQAERILKSIGAVAEKAIPVEIEVGTPNQRRLFYLLQSFPISEQMIESVETTFAPQVGELLAPWRSDTLVIARDVTILRESQEAKTHFLATLSHEVKTPVTSLVMAIRLLQKGIDQIPSPVHRKLVRTSVGDIERLRALLDDFLNVTLLDSLTQRLERRRVDFGKLVRKSAQFFRGHAFEKGIELNYRVEGDENRSVELELDATKISWALSNLITNALRHTPRGGRVEVALEIDPGEVRVRVSDSGPGIDRHRQDRVFERFTPYYDLRVGRSGSVGMGLAIAREIVSAHGGKIWLHSEPGKGSDFCFSLPFSVDRTAGIAVVKEIKKGESFGENTRSG